MVYRPPKHKSAPGTRQSRPTTDPLSGAVTNADEDVLMQGDDRNLVAVDESYNAGDFEDRLWLFWRTHNHNVLRLLLAVCVAVFLWQGWNFYQARQITNLQAAYDTATASPESLLAFSQANPETALGKVALLEAADSLYKNGRFKDAAEAYSKATTAWAGDEKSQRAQLGWAMSQLATNDLAGAHQHLEALYTTATNLENFRAEAAFDNAVIYAQSGDKDNATTWIDRAESLTGSPAWSSQAKAFREILPLMSDVKLISGDYKPTPDAAKLPALSAQAITPAAITPVPAKPSAPAATAAPTPVKPAPAATGAASGFDLSKLKGSQ